MKEFFCRLQVRISGGKLADERVPAAAEDHREDGGVLPAFRFCWHPASVSSCHPLRRGQRPYSNSGELPAQTSRNRKKTKQGDKHDTTFSYFFLNLPDMITLRTTTGFAP